MWRTRKPYVIIAILLVAVIAAFWWWNDQSPFATPKDGSYACSLVEIGADGKYTLLTSEPGAAEVEGGEVISVTAAGGSLALDGMTVQPRGTAHFRVVEGVAGALANPVGSAIACTHTGD